MASRTQDDAAPTYLATPPENCGEAPISTRPQRLRLGSLTPRDFERLCHRLARVQGSVEDVRIFGVPGQAQDGIDLYARRHDGTYVVIQCKRSSDTFTPGEITEAVDKFLWRGSERPAEAVVFFIAAAVRRGGQPGRATGLGQGVGVPGRAASQWLLAVRRRRDADFSCEAVGTAPM
ncbi:hypothetical protein AAW14_02525 [Streptomyces hygroscopicus]|uniref:restriction endonuclease n=1 Tax=Streptomyces hygroscopicus TaxID=1912 RepID=UPI002240256B|nr:restriction endonuclease [Streptomyces hygroscopicus]MCW7940960.1 hypothetical protein [Streptomyces hygroscopicus]